MELVAHGKTETVFKVATAGSGWFALLLQFPLTFLLSHSKGMSIAGAVTTYFSFFTVLTNILVSIGLTCTLLTPQSRLGRFLPVAP